MSATAVYIVVVGIAILLGLMLWSTIRRSGNTVWNTSGRDAELVKTLVEPLAPDPTVGFPRFRMVPGQVEIVTQREGLTVFDVRLIHDPGGAAQRIVRIPCAVGAIPAACPPLTIARHAVLDPGAKENFLPRMSFESGLFNEQIEVRCNDERFARTLVDQRMMEWLLLLPPGHGIELTGGRVLAYGLESDRPMQTGTVIELLEGFLGQVPAVLTSLYPPAG